MWRLGQRFRGLRGNNDLINNLRMSSGGTPERLRGASPPGWESIQWR